MKQQIKDLIQRVDALERELAFLFYPPFSYFLQARYRHSP